MGIDIRPVNEKLDWVHGSPNDHGIQLSIAQTNPSGTQQKTTVTVTDAGTSGYTTAQLQKMINRLYIFDQDDNSFLAVGVHTDSVTYDDGAATDVIALVNFDDLVADVVPARGAGYT